MTELKQQIESDLKEFDLELFDIQGQIVRTVKEKNFFIRNQIVLKYTELKYSQQEIAEALDLHYSTVAKIIKNYSKNVVTCTEDNINRMKRYLKIEHVK
jgi:transposase